MKEDQDTIEKMIQYIQKDLSIGLEKLQKIINIIQNKDSIDSHEKNQCKNCDKNCGRTNAEIYTCIMDKIQQTKKIEDQYERQQYTKEILEQDLINLKITLDNCYNTMLKMIGNL